MWEKCTVILGLKPGTFGLLFHCSTDWHVKPTLSHLSYFHPKCYPGQLRDFIFSYFFMIPVQVLDPHWDTKCNRVKKMNSHKLSQLKWDLTFQSSIVQSCQDIASESDISTSPKTDDTSVLPKALHQVAHSFLQAPAGKVSTNILICLQQINVL